MIFDTDFIIDLMQAKQEAIQKSKELLSTNVPQAITSLTVFELYSGIARSSKPEMEKKKVLNTLSKLPVWQLDSISAQIAGDIDGALIKSGVQIDAIDSMIAGIALSRGHSLVTRNKKHFSRVPGLKLEEY